ncbi:MAG: hypothetical protein HY216_09440 [Candidatus Rokubacteria bacterium]|nr:hypothetical protein [Candidatus Rokubacteria bacterium]
MPNWFIEKLPDGIADLAVNLNQIRRLVRRGGHFYIANRRATERNTGGFLETGMGCWPIDYDAWRSIIDGPSWASDWFYPSFFRELMLERT